MAIKCDVDGAICIKNCWIVNVATIKCDVDSASCIKYCINSLKTSETNSF